MASGRQRDFKAPEERTSAVPFFIVGLLMLAVTMWTVWDETFTRRPWKSFQKSFNQYESQIVERLLAEARKKAGEDLALLDSKISALKTKLRSDTELQRLKQELAKSKLVAFEKVQDFGFAKAVYDEAYFNLQEGIRQGHDISEEKKRADEARRKMESLKPVADKAEAERDALLAKVEAKERALEELQRKRRNIAKEVSALERRKNSIKSRPYEIKQIVLRESDRNNFNETVMRVDRCETCHLAINRAGFENAPQPFRTHPDRRFYLHTHEIKKVGCTLCHGGQGTALTSVAKAHGYVKFWEDPLLKGAETQTKCYACHKKWFNIPKAPQISRGISLVRELGCFGCHNIPAADGLRKVGPDLSRISEKVTPSWIVSWIKRPKDYNPRTKMPYFSLTEKEAVDIATFVMNVGERRIPPQKIDGLAGPEAIAKGKRLFESVGCLGCHIRDQADLNPGPKPKGVTGMPLVLRNRDFGPALGRIGSKVQADWLFRWLKNPKAYWHDTVMPSLRLSDEEAKAIAAYLMSLKGPETAPPKTFKLGDAAAFKRGKRLVFKRGCPGCHVIPGMEKANKIGPDLMRFATKKPFELSFGNVVDIPKTWEAWTFGKLKNPKIYQTDREQLRMPNFDLSDAEVTAIRTFLRTTHPTHLPPSGEHELDLKATRIELGRRMLEKYNCFGCHVIENWGGNLLRRYKEKNNGPPFLNGEGAKVQPDWFFGFLRNVVRLRPWLKVRMPSFQMPEKDAAALVEYFAAQDEKLQPFVHFDKSKVKPETLTAAKDLFQKAECLSCHGKFPPPPGREPPTAPNLLFAKNRLRPEWIFRWIINPSKIVPGTKMPTFFEGAGVRAAFTLGKRLKKEDGLWIYEFPTSEEMEIAEGQPATLEIGQKKYLVRVTEVGEKKVTISSKEDLGRTIGKAELESHGEPLDENLLGGDAYEQIRALRDLLMTAEKLPPLPSQKEKAQTSSLPTAGRAPGS